MKNYGVILTKNYKAINFLRFETEGEAEKAYQEHKKKGFGVVKVSIEKAYEPFVVTFAAP